MTHFPIHLIHINICLLFHLKNIILQNERMEVTEVSLIEEVGENILNMNDLRRDQGNKNRDY